MTARTVTLFDLPGDPKYYKTTLGGLMGRDPDIAVIVVSPTIGVGPTVRELVGVVSVLPIPLMVVVSKCDMCSKETIATVLEQVTALCTTVGLPPTQQLCDMSDAPDAAVALVARTAVPIVCTSSVTGQGVDVLRALIGNMSVVPPDPLCLSSSRAAMSAAYAHDGREQAGADAAQDGVGDGDGCGNGDGDDSRLPVPDDLPFEMQVQEVFVNVAEAGPVVSGVVRQGRVTVGQSVMVGPLPDGSFVPATAVSVRRQGEPCRQARTRESTTIELSGMPPDQLRQGLAVVAAGHTRAVLDVTANVRLVPLCEGELEASPMQVVVIRGGIKRSATMTPVSRVTADGPLVTASVSFGPRPEFIRPGDKFLFRVTRRPLRFTGYGVVSAVDDVASVGAKAGRVDHAQSL